ncbi:AurF N-oxygenase family protein [Yinghuangia seranimata]|uniref:AurF N-oxygenase family protein n=1 Tax=Yinghuangia seranimata TaxID=408067 RepID=UPI00248CD909|nr:diiron oxygenase [Yinghuangia seranimata]MDI2129703.1 diiron oxygenase [Yinghuangia seranimata]
MPVKYAAKDRELVAERLLAASAKNSFDPLTEIDWDAPLLPDTFFINEKRATLYGTRTWERMSHQQRVDLTRHEVASTASVGIWFEVILMQLLIRHAYDQDMTSRHVQYAFTEIADECRHSTMFGRMVEKFEAPNYGPGKHAHELGRIMKTIGWGIQTFAAALIAEEILDTAQREMMQDETIQPLVRGVSRIHVIEEARHVRYAREEVVRRAPRLNAAETAFTRLVIARSAHIIANHLIHPNVYASVGLDPKLARREALANPHRNQTMREWGRRLVAFFEENDLMGGPGLALWRRSGLVAPDYRPPAKAV